MEVYILLLILLFIVALVMWPSIKKVLGGYGDLSRDPILLILANMDDVKDIYRQRRVSTQHRYIIDNNISVLASEWNKKHSGRNFYEEVEKAKRVNLPVILEKIGHAGSTMRIILKYDNDAMYQILHGIPGMYELNFILAAGAAQGAAVYSVNEEKMKKYTQDFTYFALKFKKENPDLGKESYDYWSPTDWNKPYKWMNSLPIWLWQDMWEKFVSELKNDGWKLVEEP